MGNVESRGFAIAVFIVTAVLVGLLLADIIYFNQIRNGKTVTKNEATSMLIFSGILFAVVLALWIWSLVAIFFSSSTRDRAINTVTSSAVSYLTTTDYGYGQKKSTYTTVSPNTNVAKQPAIPNPAMTSATVTTTTTKAAPKPVALPPPPLVSQPTTVTTVSKPGLYADF